MSAQASVTIVTGGARGIGAASVLALAARGHMVVFSYLEAEDTAKSVVAAVEKGGGRARALRADIGQEKGIKRLFAAADEEGKLVGLINNAGMNGGMGRFVDMPDAQVRRVFDVNVLGAMQACREAVSRFVAHGTGGGIVNVTSQAATFGGNGIAAYAASKAALQTFTIALAREVARNRIRVNAVSPGVIGTDMHRSAPAERRAQVTSTLPLGRPGEPEEVAATISWLLLDAPEYLTGAIVPVSGAR
ncbi:MAG: SDR family NAD(P)-dependent oxidoreductase [Alphaproteobacteria bacterium]